MEDKKKQDKATDEQLAAYEKLRQRVSKTFGQLHDKMNREGISRAIDRATNELKESFVKSLNFYFNSHKVEKLVASFINSRKRIVA